MLLDGFVVARQVYQLALHALLTMHIDAQLQFSALIPDGGTVESARLTRVRGYYGVADYLPVVLA